MKPIKHHRGEATRMAILDAAEQVFADLGFGTARLDNVADAVGIRRPSVLYYYPGKQELYDAVEADIFAAMQKATLERIATVSDPLDRLLTMLDAWLDFLVDRPTAARFIQRNVADVTPRRGKPIEFSQTSLSLIEEVMSDGIRQKVFRPISPIHMVNAVASSALYYVCNGGQLGPERRYDPKDPAQLEEFRALIHRTARAAVLMD